MELGNIANGVIRTFRFFRAGRIIADKNDDVIFSPNEKGGLTFLFELNYNTNELIFTAAITREDDLFSYKTFYTQGKRMPRLPNGRLGALVKTQIISGKDICMERFDSDYHVYSIAGIDSEVGLIEQVYNWLLDQQDAKVLSDNPFLHTLFRRMEKYLDENENALDFLESGGYIKP